MYIISLIFAPIFVLPGQAWITDGVVGLIASADLTSIMTFLGLVIPPLLTAIIAAAISDNPRIAFGSWLTTALVSCAVYSMLLGLGKSMSTYLELAWFTQIPIYGELGTILAIFLAGIINGLLYGSIAFMVSKEGI